MLNFDATARSGRSSGPPDLADCLESKERFGRISPLSGNAQSGCSSSTLSKPFGRNEPMTTLQKVILFGMPRFARRITLCSLVKQTNSSLISWKDRQGRFKRFQTISKDSLGGLHRNEPFRDFSGNSLELLNTTIPVNKFIQRALPKLVTTKTVLSEDERSLPRAVLTN